MNRRAALRVLTIFAPTVLLAVGWLWASAGERDSLVREQQQLMMRTADSVRAAVDESLVALREREDARPFYLYNHFYSPPDVLALGDPIAISPLAGPADDPRVRGYFQVDPGGLVRTPYDAEGAPDGRALAIADVVRAAGFSDLRGLAAVDEKRLERELQRYRPASRYADGTSTSDRTVDKGNNKPIVLALANQAAAPPQQAASPEQMIAQSEAAGDLFPAVQSATPDKLGQYTVSLNAWSNQLVSDYKKVPPSNATPTPQQASPSSSSSSADSLSLFSTRKSPRIARKNVPAPTQTKKNIKQLGTSGKTKQSPPAIRWGQETQGGTANKSGKLAPPDKPKAKSKPKPRSKSKSKAKNRRRKLTKKAPPLPMPSPEELIAELGLPDAPQATVEYTPMEFAEIDDALVLYRTVSHDGVTSVQGVLLAEAHIWDEWLPSVVSRYAVSEPVPSLERERDADGCGLTLTASDVLPRAFLCFDEKQAAVAIAGLDADFHTQAALLCALMGLALLAALAIERARRRAEELTQQKSAFISAISHELRTPLTTLRMHAEMLRDDLVGEEKRHRFYGHMANESVRLGHLVENVLEISRLEEGRRPLKAERTDLGTLVDGVLAAQGPSFEDKGFTLSADVSPSSLSFVCDRQAIEQILINLTDNALKYAGDEAEKAVRIEVRVRDAAIEFHVLDRGEGVPEIDRERVFERFHRVDREGKEHVVGTGLGLALVRDLARAHGGDVAVTDRAGGGADFVVTLPIPERAA